MDNDQEALLAALNTLIVDDDAVHLYESVTACIAVKAVYAPMLSGPAAVLNPLITLGRSDLNRFKALIAKVDDKRREALKPPLAPVVDDAFDKTAYMREFMYQKRQRQRRAAEIENARRPERDKLIGRARLDYMDTVAARWNDELNARLESARTAHGTRLNKDLMDTLRKQFWDRVDAQLDEAEHAVRQPIKK